MKAVSMFKKLMTYYRGSRGQDSKALQSLGVWVLRFEGELDEARKVIREESPPKTRADRKKKLDEHEDLVVGLAGLRIFMIEDILERIKDQVTEGVIL